MKQKLRQRNQTWLSIQLRRAHSEGMSLSFFVNFPSMRAAACNGERLKRRGRLKPDWHRAQFYPGWGEVPMAGPGGNIYWFVSFEKEHLPAEFQSLWIKE
ncbi:hypothetical protein NUF77_003809 [Yersinia enterocolitica]|uniref:hypothetical protein n=1 Tax=Yersinia kristensenii TaxID=28152 RepID=UPI001C6101F1|nr:hypothetical protein [Yersinia kristensenii]EKN3939906.1 hypothetical protein [Yersinia enterocolitica]MBW5818292.1 hypothetical protein [Yersinia kristensenii]